MLSQLKFVARKFWPGAYGLGDCDEFGGVPYRAPHRSPLPNVSGRVAALTPEEILLAAEEDDSFLGLYDEDEVDATLSTMESEPTADPDPADAFPRVLKPALLENTSGLLPRKLLRGASRLRHGHRSWKATDPLYRRHRRLARQVEPLTYEDFEAPHSAFEGLEEALMAF